MYIQSFHPLILLAWESPCSIFLLDVLLEDIVSKFIIIILSSCAVNPTSLCWKKALECFHMENSSVSLPLLFFLLSHYLTNIALKVAVWAWFFPIIFVNEYLFCCSIFVRCDFIIIINNIVTDMSRTCQGHVKDISWMS
jgi:hypothetical protein